ncbi:MAG: hypothetical protein NWS07_02655 [Desulfobacterales bacterium]|jgi:hypothetical protein|nr:hypothetical protein [Desulfobacterales bacterium]
MSLSDKHKNDNQPDPAISQEIHVRLRKDALACAVAFDIARKLGCTPAEVGRTADLLHISLVKCQLGLFGYKPQKKIVDSRMPQEPALGDAIRDGLVDDRLPCKTAWRIAAQFGVPKMTVSSACEALGIKIKPCQLGAF